MKKIPTGRRLSRSGDGPLAWFDAAQEINDVFSAEDWATTLIAAAGEPDIKNKLLAGYNAAGKNFRFILTGTINATFSPAKL